MVNAIDRGEGAPTETVKAAEAAGARAAEEAAPALARALAPGALLLRGGAVEGADDRARELLGLADASDASHVSDTAALADAEERLATALGEAGFTTTRLDGEPALLPLGTGGRPLVVQSRRLAGAGETALVLLSDPEALAGAADALVQAQHLRTLVRISPAVAHDLRAPINAMVFNLEILKETIAAGKGAEPAGRERQLRYVGVLRDELARLHGELEIFLSQTSGRGDQTETLDLRELVAELAALLVPPGRKVQVQVASILPEQPVRVAANRWLLRQALLQVGVAALAAIARPGQLAATLEVLNDARNGERGDRARLTLSGAAAGAPAASFEMALTGLGREAEGLYVARALLAAQGAVLAPRAAGGAAGFEVEWRISAT